MADRIEWHPEAVPGPYTHGNEAIHVNVDHDRPWNGTVFHRLSERESNALVALTFGATLEECAALAVLFSEGPAMVQALRNTVSALQGRVHSRDALHAVEEARAILARIDGEGKANG